MFIKKSVIIDFFDYTGRQGRFINGTNGRVFDGVMCCIDKLRMCVYVPLFDSEEGRNSTVVCEISPITKCIAEIVQFKTDVKFNDSEKYKYFSISSL